MKKFVLSMYRSVKFSKGWGYELTNMSELFNELPPKTKRYIFYEKNEKCAIKVMNRMFDKKFKTFLPTCNSRYSLKREKNKIILKFALGSDIIFEVK